MFGINPYAILAALGIGIALMIGAYFTGDHVRGLRADRDIARLHADADQAIIDHNAKVAQIDNDNIVNTLTIQANYEAQLKANEAGSAGYAKRYTDLLRKRPASCGGKLPAEAGNTERVEVSPSGGDGGLSERAGKDLERLGGACNRLATLVRELAVPWALSVGR